METPLQYRHDKSSSHVYSKTSREPGGGMVTQLQFFPTQLHRVQDHTMSIRSLFLDIPPNYPAFFPGHVVRVQLGKHDISKPTPVKPYCICSLQEDGLIELCVDRVSEQGVSGSLHQLPLGAQLLLSKPTGRFVLDDTTQRPLLFVGLGSGIGAVRGMMRQHFTQAEPSRQKVCIYAVNTDETAIPYELSLEADSETYGQLEVYPVLQTNGYDVDDLEDRILSHMDHVESWEAYLAGPDEPVQELKSRLLEIGVPADYFRVQGYL